MHRTRLAALGLVLFASSTGPRAQEPAPQVTWRSISFNAGGVGPVAAELGEIQVPRRHADPAGAMLPLQFIRFRSRHPNPGPPIVYLAGGPGGSGIAAAAGGRWPIFDALRDVADVIALDQRGTGRAHQLPTCRTGTPVPRDQPSTRGNLSQALAAQVRHCRAFWRSEGIDLSIYTTAESAGDLVDLKRALGVTELDLWGISYGTHLALAALKRSPSSFRRVVLVSAEGLDDTAKLPAHTDAFFARVQASIDASPEARAAYPDAPAMVRRVIERVRSTPVTVRVQTAGGPADIVLGDFELQRLIADRIGDPPGTATVLAAFARADAGDYSVLGGWAQRVTGEPIFLDPMPLGMDAASGVSAGRRATIGAQAPASLLGDALAWPVLHAGDSLQDLDLGESFRARFQSDHRALIVSGTLDGRTYPEAHREVAGQFRDPVFISVIDGGHNSSLAVPEVQRRIKAFLAGEPVPADSVAAPPPVWVR